MSLLPVSQDDFNWHFEGLLALYDPPKLKIADVFKDFYNAGIDVKIITGDYPETAVNIAGQTGISNHVKYSTGEQVMSMNPDELNIAVKNINVFARMFPDAKLKVIEALKANGEIVVMTGDGVNDGPALKSASIGIAMGKRGTEIARQASDLILTDDNLDKMVIAIREGRKIFTNLKKAVRYIISIHIPIVLVASLPVILGWTYPNIFTPIHVIFMELIMGPTCSIFFRSGTGRKKFDAAITKKTNSGIFTRDELFISILQGIAITAGALSLYYYYMNNGFSLELTRAIVFTTLILSNVFLTLSNRSFVTTIYYTIQYKNILAPIVLIVLTIFLAAMHFRSAVRNLFQLETISLRQFWICLGTAFASVMWFEVYKAGFLKLKTP